MGNMLEGISIYSVRVKWSHGSVHKAFFPDFIIVCVRSV